jgi:tetratricopeptide (TPR) repeat protein
MKRLLPSVLLVGGVILAVNSAALAQDRIRYFDRAAKKEIPVSGAIQEETPGRVVYRAGTGAATKDVPARDIIDITYEVPSGELSIDYKRAVADERQIDTSAKEADRKKALSAAIKNYQDVLPKFLKTGDKYRFAHRHVQFKVARLLVRQAEEDPAQAEEAINELLKFKKEHPNSWQISQCAKLLARLQIEKGDFEGAQKTYEDLAATRDVSKETQQECDLLVAEAMILGKKNAEAEAKLKAILSAAPAGGPQAARARVYLAQCQGFNGKLPEAVAQLEDIIKQAKDKSLIALAYNALGDCYRVNKQSREALWPYLFVDVVYHQDKQEHIKAMTQLAKLFDAQGDKARAKQYHDKLRKENK